ncbi:MAG: hypothetical protein MHPDNHAH_00392 [Anaerolineales bacterium]|nr:hypothetical protein [Anaerolineales bacterium]
MIPIPKLPNPNPGTSLSLELIALVIGIASTVIGTLVYDYIKSRTSIRVKRIKKSSDKDVEGFIYLYNKLIDESVRIDSAEIIRWVDEDRVLRKLETHNYLHYLLVGKLKGEVVSFLKTMYSRDSRYMFIAYYGIETENETARKLAAPAMMKSLAKLIRSEMKECKGVICEVEAPAPGLDYSENQKRKARIKLFKETARRLNYRLFEIVIEYLQPQMEVDEDSDFQEEKMILLYAPVTDPTPFNKRIAKEKVMEVLTFIYLQIYRPTFRHDPDKDFAYQSYLNSLLRQYESELPKSISVKD